MIIKIERKFMKERESNYDFLRVFSMLAVIMIHVSVQWVNGFFYAASQGIATKELINLLVACIYYSLSSFAVPCFLMVSGAFILDKDDNADYAVFYKRAFDKIGVPTLIFTGLYTIQNVVEHIVYGNLRFESVRSIIISDLSGWPYYHMWYMFMLIGIYLLAPFVLIIKNKIGYERFRKVTIVFLVYSVISACTYNGNTVNWDIGYVIYFLGYFMIGYVLRKEAKKNNRAGIILIILGIIVETIMALALYNLKILNGLDIAERLVKPLSPFTVISSLMIFYGFGCLYLKKNSIIEKIAGLSFTIYMFHGGVWGAVKTFIGIIKYENYMTKLDNIWAIPVFVLIVLLLSMLCSITYEKVLLFVMNKLIRVNCRKKEML